MVLAAVAGQARSVVQAWWPAIAFDLPAPLFFLFPALPGGAAGAGGHSSFGSFSGLFDQFRQTLAGFFTIAVLTAMRLGFNDNDTLCGSALPGQLEQAPFDGGLQKSRSMHIVAKLNAGGAAVDVLAAGAAGQNEGFLKLVFRGQVLHVSHVYGVLKSIGPFMVLSCMRANALLHLAAVCVIFCVKTLEQKMSITMKRVAIPVLALGLLAACASKPPVPEDQLAVARNAIDYAVDMGARDSAPRELEQARKHLAEAERAVEQGENEIARQLALESEKIARLADLRSRSVHSERQVRELENTVEALREEIAGEQGESS